MSDTPSKHAAAGARRVTLRGRSRRALGSAAVATLLLAGCSGADSVDSADSSDTAASEPVVTASTPADTPSAPAASAPADPADADATVTGIDYGFEAEDIAAGDTVAFKNGSDKEAHEMVVMRVTDDAVTLDDIQQLLAQNQEGPPPEYLEEAGFAFAMPDQVAEQTVEFSDAGRYLLLCFIPQNAPPDRVAQMMESTGSEEPEVPSEMRGPPHAVAGMIDLIEVE